MNRTCPGRNPATGLVKLTTHGCGNADAEALREAGILAMLVLPH